MKKQTRIGRNGSLRAALPQVKTHHRAEPTPPRLSPARKAKPGRDIVTCLWQYPDGRPWAQVDFPRQLFMLIQRTACNSGLTLAEFFNKAIEAAFKKGGVFAALERSVQ